MAPVDRPPPSAPDSCKKVAKLLDITETVQAQATRLTHAKSRALRGAGTLMRIAGLTIDRDADLAKLRAAFVFSIRMAGAALAFGSQVLLARWMGSREFGVFVYVWTWLLLLGCCIDLGLSSAAQRLIPQYRGLRQLALLRGFLAGSYWFSAGFSMLIGSACAFGIWMFQSQLDSKLVVPLYIACATLPAFAIEQIQSGISRSHDWVGLALIPPFVIRQSMMVVLIGAFYALGGDVDAGWAMFALSMSVWISAIGAAVIVNRRLNDGIDGSPRNYDVTGWFSISLPIFMVEVSFLLLSYIDVLALMQLASPDDVAIYYAASKTIALAAFVHFAITSTTTHRFSQHYFAGEHRELQNLLTKATRWTFWPSLAAIILLLISGKLLLTLFGADFAEGYPLMFILSIGLLARAAIGPTERLLSMIGQWQLCFLAYSVAFLSNAALCILLIPLWRAAGADAALAALAIESALRWILTKRCIGPGVGGLRG
jgi:O-antigen/teichoic acid export membrane protein